MGGSTIFRVPPRRRAPGFTLIELLVVVTIICMLFAMLLPAINGAREAARRTTCSNNIKQIALALLQYETSERAFPAAAKVSEKTTCLGCFDPWKEAQLPSGFTAGTKHGTSWILEILPQIEQQSVFTSWNRQTNVLGNAAVAQTNLPGFYCPSRRSGIRTGLDDHLNLVDTSWRGGGTDYGGCYGRLDGFMNDTADRHRFTDMSTSMLVPLSGTATDPSTTHASGLLDGIFHATEMRPASAVTDGLTNVIMVGELQRLRPLPGTSGAAAYNRTSYDGWAVGGVATLFDTATDVSRTNPGGIKNLFFESMGSSHIGGAFVAMGDASVRFLSESIDCSENVSLLPLLGSIRDGRTATLGVSD